VPAWLLALALAPTLVRETLPNGLEVTILPDPAMPVVATQVWYHVGSADEDPGSRGLAHLFEHLMFGPTATRDGRELSEYHHRHGGDDNAYTTPDETVYVSEIAPRQHLGVLEREADRMVNLAITQEALDNERRIVTEELRLRIENNPLTRLFSAAQSALLADHPYGHDTAGTREDLAAADLDAVRAFYSRHYRPDNAHVVVVGPVDPHATLEAVRRAFGPIPRRPAPARAEIPPVLSLDLPRELTLREDLPPVEVALQGYPLPPAASPHHHALELAVEILSGGSVDRVREDLVVRRGRALEGGTEAVFLRQGGALVLYAVNLPYRRTATAHRHLAQARAELARLEWLTEETLASAKRALLRREMDAVYLAASRAQALGQARWWQGDAAAGLSRAARIEAVDRAQVEAAYRRYVVDPEPVRLTLLPEKVPWYVRLFSWLYPLVSR
jgi:zinc protease